jgi:hypothetical protein
MLGTGATTRQECRCRDRRLPGAKAQGQALSGQESTASHFRPKPMPGGLPFE